ncbi:MAG: chromosome segregation protein SMC [Thermoplasmata archaeon]
MSLYLKEIQMENFKSFKRNRIPLLKGYSTVTGPNGSGKSNIADAILFVLGPRSSRVIRAGKLTDLIFNGGKSKRLAKYTRVSLIFENKDRVFPIDSDEVKLTRYVSRSPSVEGGYNSYFYINNRRSKLSEFDSLLAHARISADGYNIVQQGDVSRIVQMGNVDRRRILDSMAGISKYDEDIERADKKRSEVEENLSRIEIILDEIKKQIRQLGRDRSGALKHRELKDRMDLASRQMTFKNKEMLEHQVIGTLKQIEKFESEKEALLRRKEELSQLLEKARRELEDLENRMVEKGGDEVRELKEGIDELRVERARAEDGAENAEEAIRTLTEESRNLKKELKKVSGELDKFSATLLETETSLKSKKKDLRKKEGQVEEAEKAVSKSDASALKFQKRIIEVNKKIQDAEEELHKVKLQDDRLEATIERKNEEIAQLEESKKTSDFELKDATWQLKETNKNERMRTKNLEKLRSELQHLRERERELVLKESELEDAVKRLTRDYNQLKAEAQAAEDVQRGYTRAVRAVLESRDKGKINGIHGTVAELAKVDPKYEVALNVAAGARMQAIVVDSDSVAANAIEFLRSKRLGRAIFLPLNKMMTRRPRGKALLASKESLGFAISLVEFDPKYESAFSYVFGDTLIVEDLKSARRLMGGVRISTLDGELIEASGAMIGGQLERAIIRFGSPDKGEIDKVSRDLRRATRKADDTRKEIGAIRDQMKDAEDELRNAREGSESSTLKLSTLKTRIKEFKKRSKSLSEKIEASLSDMEELNNSKAKTADEISRLEKSIISAKDEREGVKKRLRKCTPDALSKELGILEGERSSLQEEINALESKRVTVNTQIGVIRDREKEIRERLESLEKSVEENSGKIKELEKRKREFEEKLLALEKVERSMGDELKEIRDRRDEAYKEKTRLENEIDKVIHKMDTKEDFLLGLKSELDVGKQKLAEAEKDLEGYELESTELPSAEELRRTMDESQKSIETLGPVNMRALEDYDTQKTRHQELKDEFAQLERQRKNLLDLVNDLNSRKKGGLMKVFQAINENFKRIHEELSEGGDAELVLENEKNPFEGGLLIKARPRHKKLLRLEALSGGEKSLVSMAFIFALQQYDPSPFYFLDEIDQNLDAVNAEKVALAIKDHSSVAQFIQISLRKVTLKESDNIVGVTMQEEGVSNVVMEVGIRETPEAEPLKVEVTP